VGTGGVNILLTRWLQSIEPRTILVSLNPNLWGLKSMKTSTDEPEH